MSRTIVAQIMQNLGNDITSTANAKTITALVKISALTQAVDENLTKIAAGELTITIFDEQDAVWTFINDSLATSAGLLPPWLFLQINGVTVFTGLIDPARMTRHMDGSTRELELAAQDWSISLASTYLGSPTASPWQQNTAYVVGNQVLNGSNTYQCSYSGTSSTTGIGPLGILTNQVDGTCKWDYKDPEWQRPVPIDAANSSSSVNQNGFCLPYAYQTNLQNCIFFNLPSAWLYTGATVQFGSMPIYTITLPTAPTDNPIPENQQSGWIGTPYTQLTTDVDGQQWQFEEVPSGGEGGYTNTWTLFRAWTFANDTSLTLPNVAFPAYTCISINGTQHQVTSDGNSWTTIITQVIPSNYFKVINIINPSGLFPPNSQTSYLGVLEAVFSSSPWPTDKNNHGIACIGANPNGQWTANFQIANPLAQDLEYWTVQQAVPSNPATPCYQLYLRNVNGIVIGDKQKVIDSDKSTSWTVTGVDPILQCINTLEALTDIPLLSHVYWDSDSQLEYVNEDPRKMIPLLCRPYNCDMTKFIQPSTSLPMFGWLPLRPTDGDDLFAVGDIEATLSGTVKLMTGANWVTYATGSPVAIPSYSWTGLPDTAWTQTSPAVAYSPNADWTCQILTAPSSLMPYEVWSINPWIRLRNRCYSDSWYQRENNGIIQLDDNGTIHLVNGAFVGFDGTNYIYEQNGIQYVTSATSGVNFNTWTAQGANVIGAFSNPGTTSTAPSFPVYDYTNGLERRWLFSSTNGSNLWNYTTCSVQTWSGSSWGSASTFTWPTLTNPSDKNNHSYVQNACPFVQTGLSIPTGGYILGYTVNEFQSLNGSAWCSSMTIGDTLYLVNAAGTKIASISVPSALTGGNLYTTPYATYLVGGGSIGIVSYSGSGSALTLTTLYMVDEVTALFGNTLTAIDNNRIAIFGRQDTGLSDSKVTSTWLFILQSSLSNSLDTSIIWSEKVSEGVPATLGCISDPSKAGRIIGHFGGSLFQVDTVRPFTIERWTPSGMTAIEAIEHVGQVFNCLMLPDSLGTIHVISRNNTDTPTNINVDQIKIDNIVGWKDYSSIVRVTSADGNYYYDAYSQLNGIYQQGGKLLELTSQPMIWSFSGCAGMADAMCQWFGTNRSGSNQDWFFYNSNSAAPFEVLQPFDLITLNGGAQAYRIMSISKDYVNGTASVELLTDN